MTALQPYLNMPHAAASNGAAAVLVAEFQSGEPFVAHYAPKSIGEHANREEFKALVEEAMNKMGWERSSKSRSGWKKVKLA